MNEDKEIKKNKKVTKANSSKVENEAGRNKMKMTESKNMTEKELKENSMETNVNKYKKEKGGKKKKESKFNVKRRLLKALKAHSKNTKKSVKFSSHVIEDNLKDISKYDVRDLMEAYMTYVNCRNYSNHKKAQKNPEKSSRNPNTIDRSLEKTFRGIFTRYGEWLENFMEAYEKRSDAKKMTQMKINKGRRPRNKALPDAGKEHSFDVNAKQNILKDGFGDTVKPEDAGHLTGVMQCIATEISEASENSARSNMSSVQPVTITPKAILRGLDSAAELKVILNGDSKACGRKRKVKDRKTKHDSFYNITK